MRILVVGAGGTGGYFGGRLLAAGRDVTFLVRPRRAAQLAARGLVIEAVTGDAHVPDPPTVQADTLAGPYDLVILSCKAYDLDDAIASFAPAVGPQTMILPLLNGMRHVEALVARFGDAAVLGGLCMIVGTLDADGTIRQMTPMHTIVFGERDGARTERIAAVERELVGAGFEARYSDAILQEMWDKWVFIATGAALTSFMRGTVGDVAAVGGAATTLALLDECAAIAAHNGHAVSDAVLTRTRRTFTEPDSPLTTSMSRDLENGNRTEGDHLIGDLLRRGTRADDATSILRAAVTHVAVYERRRAAGSV